MGGMYVADCLRETILLKPFFNFPSFPALSSHGHPSCYCCPAGLLRERRQPVPAEPASQRGPLTALTTHELTRAVVARDDVLRSLQSQLSLCFKLEPSCPLAVCLLDAVKKWQADHRRGQPHPRGSCSVAVTLALLSHLVETRQDDMGDSEALAAARSVLQLPPASLCHEFSHASARVTAKQSHVLLEVRPHLQSLLMPHLCYLAAAIQASSSLLNHLEHLCGRPVGP